MSFVRETPIWLLSFTDMIIVIFDEAVSGLCEVVCIFDCLITVTYNLCISWISVVLSPFPHSICEQQQWSHSWLWVSWQHLASWYIMFSWWVSASVIVSFCELLVLFLLIFAPVCLFVCFCESLFLFILIFAPVCLFVCFWCNSLPVGQDLLIHEVSRSCTTMHYSL